jgi:hypothetical protein
VCQQSVAPIKIRRITMQCFESMLPPNGCDKNEYNDLGSSDCSMDANSIEQSLI